MNYARKLFRLLVVLFAVPLFSGCDSDDSGSSVAPPPTQFLLTVGKLGTGSGTVTSPAGINCGTDCSQSFDEGTSVTLTASVTAPETFGGWGGACASAGINAACTLTMNAAQSVTATFNSPTVGEIVAVTASKKIISFNRASIGTINTNLAISGLVQSAEAIKGIDRRANNAIYAITTGGTVTAGTTTTKVIRLYTVSSASGAATLVATLTDDTSDTSSPFNADTAAATDFAVDFDPTDNDPVTAGIQDRLRVVSNLGDNWRINPDSGTVITDTNLAQQNVRAAAYTNNFAGNSAFGTLLYVIDTTDKKLFLQNPPNSGTTALVADITGLSTSDVLATFDIQGTNVDALAVANNGTTPKLYQINVTTGAAANLGTIGGGEAVTALALPLTAAPGAAGAGVALTQTERLLTFDPTVPGTVLTLVQISGMQAGEKMLGIDTRHDTGVLYGLGSTGRLYTLGLSNGVASFHCVLAGAALNGTDFGFDFEPTTGRIRVVSDTGQNLNVDPAPNTTPDPDECATVADVALNVGGITQTGVTAAAYTNSFLNTGNTTFYVVNSQTDTLHTVATPADGVLTSIGSLGVNADALIGFDIDGRTGLARLASNDAGVAKLSTVSLTTGAASGAQTLGTGEPIRGLSLATPGVPQVFAIRSGGGAPILSRLNLTLPSNVTDVGQISGLESGETILGLEFRPADGLLYALGSSGRIYRLPTTAPVTAELVSTLQQDIGDLTNPFLALDGVTFGVDFNPSADRLRVVSNTNQNLRINPDTGATTTDTNLARAAFQITGAAYNSNLAGNQAAAPTLFVLDSLGGNILALNTGTNGLLSDATRLNLPAGAMLDTGLNGLEIIGAGRAVAAAQVGATQSGLFDIDLATGNVTLVGNIFVNTEVVVGLASQVLAMAAPNPVMAAVTDANRLVTFPHDDPGCANPASVCTNVVITGLLANEKILSIDYRHNPNPPPAGTTTLYALGDGGGAGAVKRLYTIANPAAAVASLATTLSAEPTDMSSAYVTANLDGVTVGMDFSTAPQENGIVRLVTSAGLNLRVNANLPQNSVTTDTALNRTTPRIAAAAYSNNSAGAATTTLYVLNVDGTNDALLTQDPPNDGTLRDVNEPLGANFTDTTAFDVLGGHNGLAIAVSFLNASGNNPAGSRLFRINLTTGSAALVGAIGPDANAPFTVTAIALRFRP